MFHVSTPTFKTVIIHVSTLNSLMFHVLTLKLNSHSIHG